MKDFDFEEWRKRYMNWIKDNRARIMDFFRRQDKDHDGKISREEFIEGILQSSTFVFVTLFFYIKLSASMINNKCTQIKLFFLKFYLIIYKMIICFNFKIIFNNN